MQVSQGQEYFLINILIENKPEYIQLLKQLLKL